ncbi:MAG: hypothetical protein QXF06_00405 [Archaeoglobaceae archaeon]
MSKLAKRFCDDRDPSKDRNLDFAESPEDLLKISEELGIIKL